LNLSESNLNNTLYKTLKGSGITIKSPRIERRKVNYLGIQAFVDILFR